MLPLKIAVAAQCFDRPLKQVLAAAREIGAQGLQFDARHELVPRELSQTGRRELLHRLDELGLAVASLAFSTERAIYDAERLEARLEALKQAMQFAASLKCRVLTVRLGRLPADDSPEHGLMLGVLNELARFGNHIGVTIAVTPARESPQALSHVVRQVTEGPLGVNFDPAAFLADGCDVIEAFRTLHDSVVHIRVRDAVRESDDSVLEVPVGRGEVEWDALLALTGEAAFRGWLTVDRTAGQDKQGDAARAIEYLRRLGHG